MADEKGVLQTLGEGAVAAAKAIDHAQDAALRGIVNGLTFGLRDNAQAGLDSLATGQSYTERLKIEGQKDKAGGLAYEAGLLTGAVVLPVGEAARGIVAAGEAASIVVKETARNIAHHAAQSAAVTAAEIGSRSGVAAERQFGEQYAQEHGAEYGAEYLEGFARHGSEAAKYAAAWGRELARKEGEIFRTTSIKAGIREAVEEGVKYGEEAGESVRLEMGLAGSIVREAAKNSMAAVGLSAASLAANTHSITPPLDTPPQQGALTKDTPPRK